MYGEINLIKMKLREKTITKPNIIFTFILYFKYLIHPYKLNEKEVIKLTTKDIIKPNELIFGILHSKSIVNSLREEDRILIFNIVFALQAYREEFSIIPM